MRENREYKNRRNQSSQYSFMPSPTQLESYEEIAPGLVAKLTDLVRVEQKARLNMEEKRMQRTSFYIILGQMFNFLSVVAILFMSYIYFKADRDMLAAVICISGFAFLLCVMLIPKKSQRHKSYNYKPRDSRASH